jgi:hypothetical protein
VTGVFPSRQIVRAYGWRGVRLWLVVRAAVSFLLFVGDANPARLSSPSTLMLFVLLMIVAFVDVRRRHELVLLGNLGVHPAVFAVLLGGPALIGELLVRSGAALLS